MPDNPLLGMMGYSGPTDDQGLLQMASEWPPRWWKRLIGQPDTPARAIVRESARHPQTLPTVHVYAVDGLADQFYNESLQAWRGSQSSGPAPKYEDARREASELLKERGLRSVEDLGTFVNDTLMQLIGGAPPSMEVGRPRDWGHPWGPQPTGSTNIYTRGVVLEKDLSLEGPSSAALDANPTLTDAQSVASHELGHIATLRGSLPWLNRIATKHYRRTSDRTSAASSPVEYEAELFSLSTRVLEEALHAQDPGEGYRNLQESIAQREAYMPGLSEAVSYLLVHPMFQDSPIGQLNRQRLNQAIGLQTK